METIQIIGSLTISLVLISISLVLLRSLGYEIETDFTNRFIENLRNIYFSVFKKEYFNICDSYDKEYVSVKDFETLLDAFYNGLCKDSKIDVILSFSLTKRDISKIAKRLGIAKNGKLIMFKKAEPIGAGALIVNGNYSNYIFKKNDQITIWYEGYPEPDVLLNLTGIDCNLEDKRCSERGIEHDEWKCPITKDRDEGEKCDCSGECREDLICDETKHCCPPGKIWTGNKCEFKYTFTLLFIQLNEKIDNFKEKAEIGKDTWIELTPLHQCPDSVRLIVVDDKICQVPDQHLLCSDPITANNAFLKTNQAILDCVRKWGYNSIYTRVEGVVPGENVCCVEGGCLGGYTGGYGYPLVSSEYKIKFVSSHEMGHTFGLCDESYGGGTCTGNLFNTCESKYCSPIGGGMGCEPGPNCCPNKPEMESIMCPQNNICGRYGTECTYAERFASTSYAHLEKELGEYCE